MGKDWRKMLFSSLYLADKLENDEHLSPRDFHRVIKMCLNTCNLCEQGLQEDFNIVELESTFLKHIKWTAHIRPEQITRVLVDTSWISEATEIFNEQQPTREKSKEYIWCTCYGTLTYSKPK